VGYKRVSSGYVETMGIPIIAGSTFSPADNHGDGGEVMVDRLFVDRFWPGENPVGKQLRLAHQPDRWYSVAGVVGQTLEMGVRREARPMVYFPLMSLDGDDGWSVPAATYIVRSRNPSAVAESIHSRVWSVDSDIPIAGMRTGGEIVAESIVQLAFTMVTLGLAAVLALILGTVGLYGVLSYAVAQRRQEIAVHMALGARQGDVMQKVVGDGAKITAVGIVGGLAGAWALTRLLSGILFGVEALDPVTYGGMALALLLVAVAAAYLPARNAAAVDPVEAMRAE
jgi:putative ABC transport system permease protein